MGKSQFEKRFLRKWENPGHRAKTPLPYRLPGGMSRVKTPAKTLYHTWYRAGGLLAILSIDITICHHEACVGFYQSGSVDWICLVTVFVSQVEDMILESLLAVHGFILDVIQIVVRDVLIVDCHDLILHTTGRIV